MTLEHRHYSARGPDRPSHCLTAFPRQSKNQDLSTFTEVARVPRGMEWLWHPQILGLYKRVLNQCETNSTTREAAAGALQNITAGDRRVSSPTVAFTSKHVQMRPKGS